MILKTFSNFLSNDDFDLLKDYLRMHTLKFANSASWTNIRGISCCACDDINFINLMQPLLSQLLQLQLSQFSEQSENHMSGFEWWINKNNVVRCK